MCRPTRLASLLAKVTIVVMMFFISLAVCLGGENIKEINRKSGAYVELDKNLTPMSGTILERVFKIRGTPEQIVTAQQLMYEKVANSASGAADLMTPIEFQQQYKLPMVGARSLDGWGAGYDPYSTNANPNANAPSAADPYSQWAAAYAQWPQSNRIRTLIER
jgi:hypothetical protein